MRKVVLVSVLIVAGALLMALGACFSINGAR